MLYSCTHMATVGIKGLKWNNTSVLSSHQASRCWLDFTRPQRRRSGTLSSAASSGRSVGGLLLTRQSTSCRPRLRHGLRVTSFTGLTRRRLWLDFRLGVRWTGRCAGQRRCGWLLRLTTQPSRNLSVASTCASVIRCTSGHVLWTTGSAQAAANDIHLQLPTNMADIRRDWLTNQNTVWCFVVIGLGRNTSHSPLQQLKIDPVCQLDPPYWLASRGGQRIFINIRGQYGIQKNIYIYIHPWYTHWVTTST